MRIRRVLTAGLATATLVLTGCGTTIQGSAAPDPRVAVPSQQITTPAEPPAAPTTADPGSDDPDPTDPGAEDPGAEEPGEDPGAEDPGSDPAPEGELTVEEFAAFLDEGNLAVESARGTMVQESTAGNLDATFEMSGIASGSPSMLMSMTQEVSGQTVALSILLVDGVAYLGGDDMLTALGVDGGSGSWLLLDPDSDNPLIAQLADEMGSVAESAGVSQAEQLVAVADSVTEVGPTQVEGYDVVEYEVVVDGAAVATQLGAPAGSSIADVPIRLWVTPEGAMVRMEMSMDIGGESNTTVMTMVDHNEPIEIVAPSPDELVELPS